jgi:hypothetical protein
MSLTRRSLEVLSATMRAAHTHSAEGTSRGEEFAHDRVYRSLQDNPEELSGVFLGIADKIKATGWANMDPILVVRGTDGTLVVADGHHRLAEVTPKNSNNNAQNLVLKSPATPTPPGRTARSPRVCLGDFPVL